MPGEIIVRAARSNDLPLIKRLIRSMGVKWFGNIRSKYNDLHKVFTTYQTHRLIVLKSSLTTELIAYAEFCNYPPIDGLPRDEWLQWLQHRYCLHMQISMLNTLFFNFCIYNDDYPDLIKTICREVYYIEGKIVHMITVRMPRPLKAKYYTEHYDDLERYASVLYPHDFSLESNTNTQSLYVIFRYEILPKIVYRKALPEDNDDIIEMQEFDNPELRLELGDYYVAEELLGRNEDDGGQDTIIVAEIEQPNGEYEAGGFLWLSKNVDVRFLVENYELSTFGYLVRYDENLPSRCEEIIVSKIRAKKPANLFQINAMDNLEMNTVADELVRLEANLSIENAPRMDSIVDKAFSKHFSKLGVSDTLLQKFAYINCLLSQTTYYSVRSTHVMHFKYNVEGDDPDSPDAKIRSNVFLMKHIGLHTKYPINRLFNCLINAFSAFPDREYCMMSIPKQANMMRCNEEVLKYFLPVVQCPSSTKNLDDVYITHRSTLHGDISLNFMREEDIELIKAFIIDICVQPNYSSSSNNIPRESSGDPADDESDELSEVSSTMQTELKTLMAIMHDVLHNPLSVFSVLTICCGSPSKQAEDSVMIGFTVLKKFYRHRQLNYHFLLPMFNTHLKGVRAEIITMRLHPLFRIWSDAIFRDISRKTGFLDFYYICPKMVQPLTNELKEYMMPVEPKPMKNICARVESSERSSSGKVELHIANFYTDHLMLFRHKLDPSKFFGNSSKLLIIGFSSYAMAFLRKLIFEWNSLDKNYSDTYTCLSRMQITVICKPGTVEACYIVNRRCPYCAEQFNCYISFATTSSYVRDCLCRIDLRQWVYFVPGFVRSIDSDKQIVKLADNCKVKYDTLLIMNNTTFKLNTADPFDHRGRLPSNLIELNRTIDRIILMYKIRVLLEERTGNFRIVVYGNNIGTVQCINFLITHGVTASHVVWVQPNIPITSEKEIKAPYIDTKIQYILEDMIADTEVKIYQNYQFASWLRHTSGNFILQALFNHQFNKSELKLDTDLFISCELGYLSHDAEKWLQLSGIACEDNKILVDQNYRTNHPNIYAMGDHIAMPKNTNYQYRFVSEREAAEKLMHILNLNAQNSTSEGGATPTEPYDNRFSQPFYYQAQLPNGYLLTKLQTPRRFLSSYVSEDHDCSITTYRNGIFCRVKVSTKFTVEQIVVVSNDNTRLDFLEYVCGKHEKLLNNLMARFKAGTIKCLLKFFQEPWTQLIMHERFPELQMSNHALLKPALRNQLMTTAGPLMKIITKEFLKLNKQYLEESLLNFLRKYRRDFQHQFALPEDFLTIENLE